MASNAPALPRGGTPADQIARWIEQFRDRINLNALDAHARKRVRLLVGGPRAEEFAAVIDPAGGLHGAVLERAENPALPLDDTVRAAVYCRSIDDPPLDLELCARAPVPVFVAEYGAGSGTESIATSPPEKKPALGKPAAYRLQAHAIDEMRKYLLPDLVAAYHGLEVPLGAALPVLRPTVAAKLTLDCAVTSLKVAAASALADHVPLLGFVLGGIASAGDTIAITGLQINMLLNIAGTYGKRPELARVVELLPVIGGGYGWRTLARELSGFIPVAGIAIKAGIAYAGTLVVGQAAAYYYEHGTPLGSDKTSALYYDALARAKKLAADLIARARKK